MFKLHHLITIVMVYFIASITSITSTQAQNAKPKPAASGFALSVGQLSPMGFGLVDDDHLNIGTRIGYRTGRLQPFMVLDFTRVSGEVTDSYIDYNIDGEEITIKDEDNFSANLLTIGAGLKYLLTEPKAKRVQSYLLGSVYTMIPTAESNGNDFQDELEDTFAFGLTGGFGAQYAFSGRFSAGLELGLSYATASAASKNSDDSASGSLLYLYQMLFLEFVL